MSDSIDRLNRALADRYRVDREIGEGGMATVYLAEDVKHGRKVALKVLKPELSAVMGGERFLAEIRTTANLQHPHILPLYDSGQAEGLLFYVMPYVEGVSLRDRLNREQQLPVDEAIRIASAVSNGLDYAHRQGVIHRDVKPGNILLQDGEPVIADFGIALAVQEAGGGRLTEAGLSLGTPYYMSPEQATADRDPGPRSDVYSLACVVYEMLTGEPPFTGRSAQAVVARILTETVKPPGELRSTVPAHVDAAVMQALRKIPADRFGTAAAFGEALNDPSFGLAIAGRAPGDAPARRGLWNPLSIGATILAVGLLGFTTWSALRPGPPPPVRRYSLALPADQAMDPADTRPRIALSPDGERIVYLGPGPQGISRLWVRDRDELSARPLPGTEGAAVPFFSPDGQRIGFVRRSVAGDDQSVEFASLTGGPAVTLVDERVGLDGAAWGTDGFIYYDGITGAGTVGLMRVPEDGGPLEQVTVVDTASGESDHVWPQLLPGGRGILFTILRGGDLERADVAVHDLKTQETRVVVRAVRGRYSESGHALFVRADGTLEAIRFDPRRMEPSGDAVPLAEGLGLRINGSVDLEVSRSGTLLYVTGAQALEPRELLWIDREGRVEPAEPGWFDEFSSLDLSPDGSRVATSIAIGGWGGNQEIYVKKLSGGPLSRLTVTEDIQNHRPEWTPDGRAVAFLSNRAGEPDLYRRLVDASTPAERIFDGSNPITDFSYTRDGDWLVYAQDGDLFALRAESGSTPVPLVTTPAHEMDPRVSPDGRWLAYSSNESGSVQVYVSPFPNTGSARHIVTADGGFSPLWGNDGSELFHKTAKGEVVAVKVALADEFRIEGREVLFTVTSLLGWAAPKRYAVSPDSRRFLVIHDRSNLSAGELIVVDGIDQVVRERLGR